MSERKQRYFSKLIKLLDDYPKIYIVSADNVGSGHLQRIRNQLRSSAVILMGKNTMIRKAIRGHLQNNPNLEELLPHIKGNIGFIFFKGDETEIKRLIDENRVSAGAKAGIIAPNDVVIPAGLTGMEPTMTGFLQGLGIQSKITKGQVELTHDVHLIKEGARVGLSEATLLSKLSIKPFRFGLIARGLFQDGAYVTSQFLTIGAGEVLSKFQNAVSNVTAASLQLGFPTYLSVPHNLLGAYKNILAFGLSSEFKFRQIDELKKASVNAPAPSSTPAPTSAPTPAPTSGPKPEDKKPEPAKPASEEEEPMNLFD